MRTGILPPWFISLSFGVGLWGCTSVFTPAVASDDPPNFVVILADDLGAKELGCYGNTKHHTPNLDLLAGQAMRFRTCFATPICSSSRVMLLTGRYGFRTGWYNFTGRPGSPTHKNPDYELGTAEITFDDVLQQKGYTTALAGRWLCGGYEYLRVPKASFDEYFIWALWGNRLPPGVRHTGGWQDRAVEVTSCYWHPCLLRDGLYVPTGPKDYGPDLICDFAIDFLRRHRDKPFLLYYAMNLPHSPYEPTPDLERPGGEKSGNLQSYVEYMDHLVGRVVRELDKLNLREKTVVLFTGDNGTAGSGKADPTELGVRVPLIVSCPETVPAGAVSDELVDLTDVLPTLADLAGAPLSKHVTIDGRSLAPTLRGQPGSHRDWIFSYLHEDRILRDKRWLLEGDGRFFDCGERRDGSGYVDVSDSEGPQVLAARKRFENILKSLPAPRGLQPCPYLERHKAQKRGGANPGA
ncbi:MAG: hypothetical protein CMJ81_10775 [Planctomycetaceae bacterium]|nr:hypothetical protein [Planctomycetaceae bacterium]